MIRAEAGAAVMAATAAAASAAVIPLLVGRIPALNTTHPPGLRAGRAELELGDVDRLRALVALLLVVGDLRALRERPVAVARDAAEVDEQVPAALIGRDEAEALVVAEPLDRPGAHSCFNLAGCTFDRPVGPVLMLTN